MKTAVTDTQAKSTQMSSIIASEFCWLNFADVGDHMIFIGRSREMPTRYRRNSEKSISGHIAKLYSRFIAFLSPARF